MPDLPEHHYPPGQDIPGVASDNAAFRDQIRAFLRYRKRRGNAYVTARDVASEFDVLPQKAGKQLARLAETSDLELWNDTSSASRTYRIEVDDTEVSTDA